MATVETRSEPYDEVGRYNSIALVGTVRRGKALAKEVGIKV